MGEAAMPLGGSTFGRSCNALGQFTVFDLEVFLLKFPTVLCLTLLMSRQREAATSSQHYFVAHAGPFYRMPEAARV